MGPTCVLLKTNYLRLLLSTFNMIGVTYYHYKILNMLLFFFKLRNSIVFKELEVSIVDMTPTTHQIQYCYSLNPETTLGTRHRTKPQNRKKKRNNIHNTENLKVDYDQPHHEKGEKVINQVPRECFSKDIHRVTHIGKPVISLLCGR